MKNNKIAFSLIEVIIATSILTMTVFGVYKLISENTKIINNSANYLQQNTLFPALKECITSKGLSSYPEIIGTEIQFNFGSDLKGCEKGNSNNLELDGIDYTLKGKILEKDSNHIKWEMIIESSHTNTKTLEFIQK